MRWRKLVNFKEETLWRGTIFRILKGRWPHEPIVDLMLISVNGSPSGFSLVVATGYKAGNVLCDLPKSALAKGNVHAISLDWIKKSWSTKIYECSAEDVRLIENYPALATEK